MTTEIEEIMDKDYEDERRKLVIIPEVPASDETKDLMTHAVGDLFEALWERHRETQIYMNMAITCKTIDGITVPHTVYGFFRSGYGNVQDDYDRGDRCLLRIAYKRQLHEENSVSEFEAFVAYLEKAGYVKHPFSASSNFPGRHSMYITTEKTRDYLLSI